MMFWAKHWSAKATETFIKTNGQDWNLQDRLVGPSANILGKQNAWLVWLVAIHGHPCRREGCFHNLNRSVLNTRFEKTASHQGEALWNHSMNLISMCIYYMYIYIYTYVCVYVCVYIYIYVCMYVYIYICIYIYVNKYIYIFILYIYTHHIMYCIPFYSVAYVSYMGLIQNRLDR